MVEYPLQPESEYSLWPMATLASLRALAQSTYPALNEVRYVLGASTPNDGGGGFVFCDFTDTTSADDGMNVFVDVAGRRWKRISPAMKASVAESTMTTPQLRSSGNAPSIAAGTGAGTSPTVASMGGSTDLSGVINVTTGTSPAASANLVTVTYAVAYAAKPRVILEPANAAAAALSGTGQVFVSDSLSSPTGFVVVTGSAALAASTQYFFYYHAIQ